MSAVTKPVYKVVSAPLRTGAGSGSFESRVSKWLGFGYQLLGEPTFIVHEKEIHGVQALVKK